MLLLVINVLTLMASIALLSYVAFTYVSPAGNPLLSRGFFYSQLVFAGIILLLSVLGIMGASGSARDVAEGKASCLIVVYYLPVLIFFLVQIALAIFVFTVVANVKSAEENQYHMTSVDRVAQEWALDYPSEWVEAQDFMKCCGYFNTTGQYATGFLCSNNPAPGLTSCRSRVLSAAGSHLKTIAGVGFAVALLEAICLIAATCLMCCMRRDPRLADRDRILAQSGSDGESTQIDTKTGTNYGAKRVAFLG